jgi:hypothetical protein
MRLPRVRFTIRRLMVIVAVAAGCSLCARTYVWLGEELRGTIYLLSVCLAYWVILPTAGAIAILPLLVVALAWTLDGLGAIRDKRYILSSLKFSASIAAMGGSAALANALYWWFLVPIASQVGR